MSLVDFGKRLLEAAKRGDTDEVRTLMSNGAPFTTDWLGTSPLHFAAQYGHSQTAEVLLRAGISRDARTKVDRTPLHVACQEGHNEIVELLLRSGADIEAKDMLKMTPLHWAVEKGHLHAIQLLIKQGADINCENKFDKSPLDIGASNGRADIVQLLQLSQTANVLEMTPATAAIEEEVTTSIDETEIVTSEVASAASDLLASQQHIISPRAKKTTTKTIRIKPAEGDTDQSSTSVLATLAALAEASGPLNASNVPNTTAAESALNWLETHGITMISTSDSPSMVSSSSLTESGTTLTLTEAGKLALNLVKGEPGEEGIVEEHEIEAGGQEVTSETVLDGSTIDGTQIQQVITDESGKVMVLSAEQALQLAGGEGSVVVTVADEGDGEEDGSGEPPMKRHKTVVVTTTADGSIDQEALQKQLEEMRREAEEYKQQLREKEEEAEGYKKQLDEMVSKTS